MYLYRRVHSRLLNDAVFAAANDLTNRTPERRKLTLAISDGQEVKSTFRHEDVRDRLSRSQIQFYGVTVSVPILKWATSTLPSYANATGGGIYSGRSRDGMEAAFS